VDEQAAPLTLSSLYWGHRVLSLLFLRGFRIWDVWRAKKLGLSAKVLPGACVSLEKWESYEMLKSLALAIVLVSLRGAAMAQDIIVPSVTTADPGYLFPNDQYQRERESGTASAPTQNAPKEIELDAAAQARVKAAIEALVPEYNRRLQRDGETQANDWIRQQAFELGQREADLMKQRLGLD